jgi:hypothetical protein
VCNVVETGSFVNARLRKESVLVTCSIFCESYEFMRHFK